MLAAVTAAFAFPPAACAGAAGRTVDSIRTGIALAVAWMVLPLTLAKPVSIVLLIASVVIVGGEMIRLRWFRARRA